MRIYDYECESCGEVQEHFVKSSDVETVPCKACGGVAKRKITAMNFRLPGHDPAFPTAYEQWGKRATKRHKEADKKYGEPL